MKASIEIPLLYFFRTPPPTLEKDFEYLTLSAKNEMKMFPLSLERIKNKINYKYW